MNLLKSLATISGLTLVSRILAFVRDVLGKPRLFVIGNEQSLGANGELV